MRRRQFACALGVPWLAGLGGAAGGTSRRIAIVARRFEFSASEIRARPGETVTLEITSFDFVHGFALPELNLRVDAPPGRTVALTLPALSAGRYTYLCDNFCGEGHDRMSGTLVVADEPTARNTVAR